MLSIITKYLIFSFLKYYNYDGSYYFVYGRLLIDSIEAFIVGMFLAKLNNNNFKLKNYFGLIISLIILCLYIVYYYNYNIDHIYDLSLYSILHFPIMSIIIGLLLYFTININFKKNMFSKIILFFSKHEYGIYIWHLLIATFISLYSPFMQKIIAYKNIYSHILITFIILMISVFIDKIVACIDLKKLFNVGNKNNND